MPIKKYNLSKVGNIQLSPNFRLDEFQCNDGSDEVLVDTELVELLQALRNHYGRSIVLNSGYRTLAYNRSIGSSDGSFHVKGQAADFNVSGKRPFQVRADIEAGRVPGVDPKKIGLGSYPNFTHIDSRGWHGRW